MLLLRVMLYFNSIKVQLRLVTMDDPSNKGLFQFHKGTIKTKLSVGIKQLVRYFNSIKVQLTNLTRSKLDFD